jgi:uncharacterized protein (TIGR00251 family)
VKRPPDRSGAPLRLDLRVIPRAPRSSIDGLRDGRVVVRVTAPPVDDAANDAVVALLADELDVPRRAVRVVAGATSRNKTVTIEGVGEEALRRWHKP